MACFNEILKASGRMSDVALEPTDETPYFITVKNVSKKYHANNVIAQIHLDGECLEGIRLSSPDCYFGTLAPGQSVTKEIAIITERANVRNYSVCYHLNFVASFEACEGEVTCFEVVID